VAAWSVVLVLFGIGFFLGNLIGGRFGDRHLMPMLYNTLGGLALVLALFTLTAHNKVAAAITVVLIGALGFATVPPLQKRLLDQAGSAPTLASALNIGAFNLGNAISAWLGGVVIAAGYGYTAPNWVGVALVVTALGLAVLSGSLERRTTQMPSETTDPLVAAQA
jgi:DHA1 family inner membrane transport protein